MSKPQPHENAAITAALPRDLGREPRRAGRPEKYSPELADLVCERMIEAGSLPAACRADPRLPDRNTVYRWCNRHPDFAAQFAQARERLMERWADDIIEVAEDGNSDPNDRRVRIDTKKWLMTKLAPRRYGDKLQVAGDPENPLRVLHEAVSIERLSPVELDALERFARARLQAIDVAPQQVLDQAGEIVES